MESESSGSTGSGGGGQINLRAVFPTAHRLLLERALSSLSLEGYERIAVLGSGDDPYSSLFPDRDLYLCIDLETGYDPDILADAQVLPLPDGGFDCVVATEVYEHLENPRKLIEESHRVLSPGGILLLTVPFLFHEHGDPQDYWRPTSNTLEEDLRLFSDHSVTKLGNRVHVAWDLLTTSFHPVSVFFPLRILSHLVARLPGSLSTESTAPSGFLVVAEK